MTNSPMAKVDAILSMDTYGKYGDAFGWVQSQGLAEQSWLHTVVHVQLSPVAPVKPCSVVHPTLYNYLL
jgi:hypothetical protein